ncbi:hypothetical protein TPHA_0G01040 [Tetrapisispora phaffii CBS 4417]|uniref:Uncharacterized protein n=1 Tax=Tetrapisispora phaffii (strain ATCC 24235 / CBS 4417 / NBRC 1672 / NRRL Y-8282 / UCD 70-5) TaxID=1071381 RepID=G8BVL2_TETPH|nr:hypothetical protein TPHA_0G01040 [Tetrapisispora phaffii CBS 4417]CCE63940.1 hypothetical protein TPHA_0G01040 [Tetrapisispora phaffii CBS 4417]
MTLESKWATSSDEEELQPPILEFQNRNKNNSKNSKGNGNRKAFNLDDLSNKFKGDKPSISFSGGKLTSSSNSSRDGSRLSSRENNNQKGHSNSKKNEKSRNSTHSNRTDDYKPSISFANGKMSLSATKRTSNKNHDNEEDWEDEGSWEDEKDNGENWEEDNDYRQKSKDAGDNSRSEKPSISFAGGKMSISKNEKSNNKKGSVPSKEPTKNIKTQISSTDKLALLKKKIEEQKNIYKDIKHKKEQKQLLNDFLNNDDAFKWDDEHEEEEILDRLKNSMKI